MACLGKTVFHGQSGKSYRFRVYPWGTRFRKLSGVYVVGHRSDDHGGAVEMVPLYVGQTEDFSQPFGKHHKAQAFGRQGANCICLQADTEEPSRLAKQDDLIGGLHPVCND
jgi:hypothetical protein